MGIEKAIINLIIYLINLIYFLLAFINYTGIYYYYRKMMLFKIA